LANLLCQKDVIAFFPSIRTTGFIVFSISLRLDSNNWGSFILLFIENILSLGIMENVDKKLEVSKKQNFPLFR
jgi:hypothetical protein